MDCPKCRAPNPDDAKFCSLCQEFFGAAAGGRARGKGPGLALAHIDANIGDWTVSGPLLIREEGFYFFVERFSDRNKTIADVGLGQVAGPLLGPLIAKGLESLSGPSLPPEAAQLGPTEKIVELYAPLLSDAPKMRDCKDYFLIPKAAMSELGYDMLGMLCVKAGELSLRIQGAKPSDKVTGFLKLRGYNTQS